MKNVLNENITDEEINNMLHDNVLCNSAVVSLGLWLQVPLVHIFYICIFFFFIQVFSAISFKAFSHEKVALSVQVLKF